MLAVFFFIRSLIFILKLVKQLFNFHGVLNARIDAHPLAESLEVEIYFG